MMDSFSLQFFGKTFKIQKKNLAGKKLLCKRTRFFSKHKIKSQSWHDPVTGPEVLASNMTIKVNNNILQGWPKLRLKSSNFLIFLRFFPQLFSYSDIFNLVSQYFAPQTANKFHTNYRLSYTWFSKIDKIRL
jgi:hypothetical protein